MIQDETQKLSAIGLRTKLQELRDQGGQSDPSVNDNDFWQTVNKITLEREIVRLNSEIDEYERLAGTPVGVLSPCLDDLGAHIRHTRLSQKKALQTLAQEVSLSLGLADHLTVETLADLEKNNYCNASITLIMAVADILNVKWKEYLPVEKETQISFFNFLNSSGFNDRLLKRVFPVDIIDAKKRLYANGVVLSDGLMRRAQYYIHRIFGLKLSQLATYNEIPAIPLQLPMLSPVRYRQRPAPGDLAGNVCANFFVTLADTIAKAVPVTEINLPEFLDNPDAFRDMLLTDSGGPRLSLQAMVNRIWDMGIPIFPLRPLGLPHGIMHRVGFQNVIIISPKKCLHACWRYAILHEFAHAQQDKDKADFSFLDPKQVLVENDNNENEANADLYARRVLRTDNNELIQRIISESGKFNQSESPGTWYANSEKIIERIADEHGIEKDDLALQVAITLGHEEHWLNVASNLTQDGTPEECYNVVDSTPHRLVADIFWKRIDVEWLTDAEKELLKNACK